MKIIEQAYDAVSEGAVYCVERYRGGEVNLGTQLHRIVEDAGQVPWPKLYNNLRSTRRTELQEQFPSHVVDAWLGHSSKVADEHYLQVTQDHWDRALSGGVIPANPTASGATAKRKNRGNLASDDSGWTRLNKSIGQAGLEPATKGL